MRKAWELLPVEIYVKIFMPLSYEDRLQARIVCRRWMQCLRLPQLWYNIQVNFKESIDTRLKRIALNYGAYFRSLHIQCFQQNPMNRKNVGQFIQILYQEKQLKLEEIKLEFCEQNPLFYSGDTFLNHLKLFFSARLSNHIKKIDLSKFTVTFTDDLLKSITQNHGRYIQYLNIQNNTLIYGISQGCLLSFLKESRQLRYLYIQSSCFSGEALKVFAEENRDKLTFISLLFTRADKFFKSISSRDWLKITEVLPSLRIELYFDHTYPLDSIHKIMLPEVPVSILKLCLQATVTEHINFAASIYKNTLETLVVTTTPSNELDDAVLNIVKECKLLVDIHIWCRMAREVVDKIHQVKPSLRKYTLAYKD